jgi:hypothetical protein
MRELQIPGLGALTSVDATAIRSIVNSLVIEITKLRKEVDDLNAKQAARRNYYREKN